MAESSIVWRDSQAQCFLESFPAMGTANEVRSTATRLRKPFPGVLAAPEGRFPCQSLSLHMWPLENNSAFWAMHYAQFWLVPCGLCWSPNSALCFLRARSCTTYIISHKGTQHSTEDVTKYKRGSAEGLRGIHQNKITQSKHSEIQQEWQQQQLTFLGHLLWQAVHFGNCTITEVKLNWLRSWIILSWELSSFQLDSGLWEALAPTSLTHKQWVLTLHTSTTYPGCFTTLQRETTCLWAPAKKKESRVPTICSLHHPPGPLLTRQAQGRAHGDCWALETETIGFVPQLQRLQRTRLPSSRSVAFFHARHERIPTKHRLRAVWYSVRLVWRVLITEISNLGSSFSALQGFIFQIEYA